MKGIVKWFDSSKGYGFIQTEDGNDIFVHYSGIKTEGFKRLLKGQEVTFEIVESDRGPQATDVSIVATCAVGRQQKLEFDDFRHRLKEPDNVYLLAFGTAWGLTEEFLGSADFVLEPIKGNTGYNHLPVRAAVAIILDRILGAA